MINIGVRGRAGPRAHAACVPLHSIYESGARVRVLAVTLPLPLFTLSARRMPADRASAAPPEGRGRWGRVHHATTHRTTAHPLTCIHSPCLLYAIPLHHGTALLHSAPEMQAPYIPMCTFLSTHAPDPDYCYSSLDPDYCYSSLDPDYSRVHGTNVRLVLEACPIPCGRFMSFLLTVARSMSYIRELWCVSRV